MISLEQSLIDDEGFGGGSSRVVSRVSSSGHDHVDAESLSPQRSSTLAKFVLGGRRFYLLAHWKPASFQLTITECKRVWRGDASESYLASIAPKGMDLHEYVGLAKRALSSQDVSKKSFSYKLKQIREDHSLEFTWRIKLAEVGFSVRGDVKLRCVDQANRALQDILDWVIEDRERSNIENARLVREHASLSRQCARSIERMSQLSSEKVQLEGDMYAKFVLVVNEKKRKIRELMDERKQYQVDRKALMKRQKDRIKTLLNGESLPPEWEEEDHGHVDPSPSCSLPSDGGGSKGSGGGGGGGTWDGTFASQPFDQVDGDPSRVTFSLNHVGTPSLSLLEDSDPYPIASTIRPRHRRTTPRKPSEDGGGGARRSSFGLPPPARGTSGAGAPPSRILMDGSSIPGHSRGAEQSTRAMQPPHQVQRGDDGDDAPELSSSVSIPSLDLSPSVPAAPEDTPKPRQPTSKSPRPHSPLHARRGDGSHQRKRARNRRRSLSAEDLLDQL